MELERADLERVEPKLTELGGLPWLLEPLSLVEIPLRSLVSRLVPDLLGTTDPLLDCAFVLLAPGLLFLL